MKEKKHKSEFDPNDKLFGKHYFEHLCYIMGWSFNSDNSRIKKIKMEVVVEYEEQKNEN